MPSDTGVGSVGGIIAPFPLLRILGVSCSSTSRFSLSETAGDVESATLDLERNDVLVEVGTEDSRRTEEDRLGLSLAIV